MCILHNQTDFNTKHILGSMARTEAVIIQYFHFQENFRFSVLKLYVLVQSGGLLHSSQYLTFFLTYLFTSLLT